MLEQIKQAVDEFDALDIERKVLLTKSDQLYKQLDKLRMDLYTFHRKLDKALAQNNVTDTVYILDDIRDFGADAKETEKEYRKIQKEYSHTWPKVDLAKKKVEKLKKKFWEQEGLAL